ncbi:hypothetical protein [Haloarchaeobius litoreus]|uniref:DNA phosphorothioation-associated protein 4 n=1 Tax=Haloarchaeobius litoreus TaxID=755306 RepID=A0ABD6DNJ5_9EURY|nr:hypothetical protein [Haloarchaeobius litoreus]
MGKPIIRYRKSDLYTQVVDEYGVFNSSYDFLIFLAVVGYREDRINRNNYRGDRDAGTVGEIGLQNVFSNDLYRVIMSSLAFQEENDPAALVETSTQMKVLAQYAAGGLDFAEEEFGDIAGDPTDAILNYIRTKQQEDDEVGGELGEIVDAFDDEMMETDSDV